MMRLQLTYRQKLKALPLVVLVTLLLIYGLAIKDVMKLRSDCAGLVEQISNTKDAPREMASLEQKLTAINHLAGKISDSIQTDPLLDFISAPDIRKTVQLIEYQPVHLFSGEQYMVETRIASFEGSFLHLLGLLNKLEKEFKAGKVVSVKYQTETNFKTNRRHLLMTLYIQSLSGTKKEETTVQNPV